MKKVWTMILTVALLALAALGALAEGKTALEALEALQSGAEVEIPATSGAGAYLDRVVAGDYAAIPEDAPGKEALAADLSALSGISARDLAVYASERDGNVGEVRNAWYKALANALSAQIELHPSTEEQRQNAETVLGLFLQAGDTPEKQEIRGRMTKENAQAIAGACGLPEQFVGFVIMDANWSDDDWQNDTDWQAQWSAQQDFETVNVGARDTADSTRIADMQQKLIDLGYLKGKADGVFGARTQAALLEFQLANGLPGTGVLDAGTWDALQEADAVTRRDYDDDLWDPDDTPDNNTPDNNTPNDNTPNDNTPDNNTPDNNTPDRNTPDNNTPDNNTPDRNTSNTPDTP